MRPVGTLPEATGRLEQEMRKRFPDLQIRHETLSSGEHQCILDLPGEERKFCGKPSKLLGCTSAGFCQYLQRKQLQPANESCVLPICRRAQGFFLIP